MCNSIYNAWKVDKLGYKNLFNSNGNYGSLNYITENNFNINLSLLHYSYLMPILTDDISNLNFLISISSFITKIFKLNTLLVIIFFIFFISNFENYIKQLVYSSSIMKFFLLNESEKDVGPVDDFFFFAVLFIITLSSFVFISIFYIIIQTNIFNWLISSLVLITLLILTIPTSLFLDFGISFFVYIRGSASGNNFFKESLFDVISTATVFIRFIIQNIRFLFIFSAIFELFEWVFSVNTNILLPINNNLNNVSLSTIAYIFSSNNFNLIIINLLMFVLLYFYYTLHLLFLLLVQITIYIGISAWLFFFLYSTRFVNKSEKFFIYKNI